MQQETSILIFGNPPSYPDVCRFQERLVEQRLAGDIPDTLVVLEHRPVITAGTSAKPGHVLAGRSKLARLGVSLCRSPRGGDVTYHGPGQIVMYPILKLLDAEADLRAYVGRLEEIAIRTAADFGVEAFRRKGKIGAWTGHGKIAAIGVRARRWVTSHGLCFNVDVDLAAYSLIVPCGLAGEPVTSLKAILGAGCPGVARVRRAMIGHFSEVMGRKIRPMKGMLDS